MRLFERFAKPKLASSGFRGSSALTREALLTSVVNYLAHCLNYRLQPGAIENSLQYQDLYQSLVAISEPKSWPGVTAYLQAMEPRVAQLSLRSMSNNESAQATKQLQQLVELPRPPKGLFTMQILIGQSTVQLAALALTNGRIHLLPVA